MLARSDPTSHAEEGFALFPTQAVAGRLQRKALITGLSFLPDLDWPEPGCGSGW